MRKLMNMALPAAVLFSLATPAFSDECMRLWIIRNAIFDDRGYCFGSSLGKNFFGNAGCTTKSPSLSSNEKSRVAKIKARERALNCAAKKGRWSVYDLNEEVRRAQAQQSQPQRNTQRAAPVQQQPQTYSFQCNIPCKRIGSFTQANQRQDIRVPVNASSKSEAQNYARSRHADLCRQQGLSLISQYAYCN